MDKKQFLILLGIAILTIFVSIFFSIWFFEGRVKYEPQFGGVMPVQLGSGNNDAMFKQLNKMMENQQKAPDNMHNAFSSFQQEQFNNTAEIKSEELDGVHKISINLKPFNNDPKNVKVDIDRNFVNITAKYESKNKNKMNSSHISQLVILPFKIDKKMVKQSMHGNVLVIEITEKAN